MKDCRDCFHARTRFIRPLVFQVHTIAMQNCSIEARLRWARRLLFEVKGMAGPVRCAKNRWSKYGGGEEKTHTTVAAFCVSPRTKMAHDCPFFENGQGGFVKMMLENGTEVKFLEPGPGERWRGVPGGVPKRSKVMGSE